MPHNMPLIEAKDFSSLSRSLVYRTI